MTCSVISSICLMACSFYDVHIFFQAERRGGVLYVSLNVLFRKQGKAIPHCLPLRYYPKYIKLEVILVMGGKKMPMNF
jgi:hypothetical protein